MKALVLNSMDRRPEAYEMAKLSIRHGLSKALCWHVYGIICRCDGDYPQAIRCYRQALTRDPHNTIVIRDNATLAIQTRDLLTFNVSACSC